jgi:carbon monoxide dehydrogenase subunit G
MSLTVIESDKVEVNGSAEKVFNFLSDMNNHERLMPSQVSGWESTADECSYTLNGMAKIGMKVSEKTPNSKIIIGSHGKVPFEFKLTTLITEAGADKCTAQMIFEADLNPMMKMMVAGPMGKFFNYMAGKLNSVIA